MELNKLGFNALVQQNFEQSEFNHLSIARISAEHKNGYRVFTEQGELTAIILGKLRNTCIANQDFPAVGDWVACEIIDGEDKALIQDILPRKSKFSRKVAGVETREQIIASNIDFAFIVCALNYDFNVRRIERYLTLIWESGATPVIVLTKPDLCDDVLSKVALVNEIAFGVDINIINNISADGVAALAKYFVGNKTAVLLGSSGVGKSSLINNLVHDQVMKVNVLRSDVDKGRHTTTHRQMFVLADGGVIIDTPGVRELQLWDAQSGIDHTFNDISEIAKHCKFNDCKHENEPKCAVQQAIASGLLDEDRLHSYFKVIKEQEYLSNRQSQSAAKIERDKWKPIHKRIKNMNK